MRKLSAPRTREASSAWRLSAPAPPTVAIVGHDLDIEVS
jgi:hypothetical protein